MFAFFLKKFVSAFLLPMPIFFALAFVGLFFLWFGKRQRTAKWLISFAVVWLALFSWGPLPEHFLKSLERTYPANGMQLQEGGDNPEYIVVLGGGHVSDPDVPVSARISPESLARLAEAAAIHRKAPDTKLIFSGGAYNDPASNAQVMAEVARSIGIDDKAIVLEERPLDTKDEAKILSEKVGKKPFVLVTTASHMRRSVALFKKQGTAPIPAPTGHRVMDSGKKETGWQSFFPKSSNLEKTEVLFHEYLGLIWAKWRGQL